MIRKIFLVFCLLVSFVSPIKVKGQFLDTSVYLNGTWSEWWPREVFSAIDYKILYNATDHVFRGCEYFDLRTYSRLDIRPGFDIRPDDNTKWCFRFLIDEYICPDKKDIKKHYKSNQWYEYTGWVEYYVTDEYPTIKDVLNHYGFPLISIKGDSQRALRHAKATIKIAPYKNKPECFNIFFDNVGGAIGCTDWEWFWFDYVNVVK
ncbi:MAG: hypothetical protein HDS35_10120 [Bacteroides sp.]|nr:hypothetical protein [Bacteroides sp.]